MNDSIPEAVFSLNTDGLSEEYLAIYRDLQRQDIVNIDDDPSDSIVATDVINVAFRTGNERVVNEAMALGAMPESYSLEYICEGGNVEFMKLLRGLPDWNRGLVGAAAGGHIVIMEEMVSRGASAIGWAFTRACERGQVTAVEWLIQKGRQIVGKVPATDSIGWMINIRPLEGLFGACSNNRPEVVRCLLDAFPDLRGEAERDRTLYSHIGKGNNPEILAMFAWPDPRGLYFLVTAIHVRDSVELLDWVLDRVRIPKREWDKVSYGRLAPKCEALLRRRYPDF